MKEHCVLRTKTIKPILSLLEQRNLLSIHVKNLQLLMTTLYNKVKLAKFKDSDLTPDRKTVGFPISLKLADFKDSDFQPNRKAIGLPVSLKLADFKDSGFPSKK